MNVNQDLLGKTITGVIATTSPRDGLREIWMLQLDDGSHVEFVSPGARRALRQATQTRRTGNSQQLPRTAANTAPLSSARTSAPPTQLPGQQVNRPRANPPETGGQLTLNVA